MTVPIGTILPYGGSVDGNSKEGLARQGWLVCDGEPVSRDEYRELFNVIGDSFGAGNRTKTFNLPDLRGRFVRGVDAGQGRDPDASSRKASGDGGNTGGEVGSLQDYAMQGHTHEDKGHAHSSYHSAFNNAGKKGDEYSNQKIFENFYDNPVGKAQLGGPVKLSEDYGEVHYSKETRPTNIYVHWIIKATNENG